MRDRRSDTSIAENGNHRPEIKHGLSAVRILESERDKLFAAILWCLTIHTFFVYFSVPIETHLPPMSMSWSSSFSGRILADHAIIIDKDGWQQLYNDITSVSYRGAVLALHPIG